MGKTGKFDFFKPVHKNWVSILLIVLSLALISFTAMRQNINKNQVEDSRQVPASQTTFPGPGTNASGSSNAGEISNPSESSATSESGSANESESHAGYEEPPAE
jgi:hypothetical protein